MWAFGVYMKNKKDWIYKKAREKWLGMKERCSKNAAYLDVTIREDWLDFSNFEKWFRDQVNNGWYHTTWEIDKDIIGKGTRIYSPDHCAFVPKPINTLFSKAFNRRNNYSSSRGAHRVMSSNGEDFGYDIFCAKIVYDGKVIFHEEFDYELFAFFEYKWAFEKFIQEKAEELKDKLNPKMYDALMSYRVLPMG